MPARRCRGDSGAVIVEFALVLPFLAVITMGLAEFGNAFRERNRLEATVSSAARTSVQLGRNRFADFEALRSIASGVASSPGATVERVVIWKATAGSDGPRCLTGSSVNGLCNVYDAGQVADAGGSGFSGGSSTSPTCQSTSWDAAWCPLGRADGSQQSVLPDYVGVWVQARYPTLTRMFTGASMTMSGWSVHRIEPPVGAS